MLQLKTDKNRELTRIPKTIWLKLVNLRPGALLRAESTTVSKNVKTSISKTGRTDKRTLTKGIQAFQKGIQKLHVSLYSEGGVL